VRPRIERALRPLEDVKVIVFEPERGTNTQTQPVGHVPAMTPGRAALVGLMDRYLAGLLDPSVSLLEIQAHVLHEFLLS
jgi:hypothetical protein